MALLAACMHHAPCSTALGATAGQLRWAALIAELRGHRATAGSSSCSGIRHRHPDSRCAPRVQQGLMACRRTECNAAATDQEAAPAPPEQTAAPLSRKKHNRLQAEAFSHPATVQEFLQPLEVDVFKKLERIAAAVPDLGAFKGSRVIDVGSGTGVLIQHLQARGVKDILAVDLAPPMLNALAKWHPPPGTLGNHPGVRTWCGDIVDLPAAQGPAEAIFFNACFGNVHDQHEALWAACRLLRPGGHIVISHPLGRDWCNALSQRNPGQVPHTLPDDDEMRQLIHDLPLRSADGDSGPDDMYLRVLQVPEGYVFDNMLYRWDLVSREVGIWEPLGVRLRLKPKPLHWTARVVQGFGRGSRDLGFPTANLDPDECRSRLYYPCFDLPGNPRVDAIVARRLQMPKGVYFGFARLVRVSKRAAQGVPAADLQVHGMVMNIGERPTMEDGGGVTVEVHVFDHNFDSDFYGRSMSVLICGFLRPEIKFSGLPALVAQIRTDIGIARAQLALPQPQKWKDVQWPNVKTAAEGNAEPKSPASKSPAAEQQAADPPDPQEQLLDRLPANVHQNYVKVKHAADQLNAQPGRERPASVAEIARHVDRAVRGVESVVKRAMVASLALELGISPEDSTQWGFARQMVLAIRELQYRENDIICRRCGLYEDAIGQCLTVKQVADLYDMDESEVQEYEAKAKAGVKEMLEDKIAARKERERYS